MQQEKGILLCDLQGLGLEVPCVGLMKPTPYC